MKKIGIIAASILLSLTMSLPVFATSKAGIVQSKTLEDSISVYVSGASADAAVEATVGTSSAGVSSQAIANMATPMKTLVMIDNSISIVDKDRAKIAEMLQNLIADRMNGELIAISTFSESTTYLCDYTSDYKELKAAVDSLTYNDQETYLTDVLYELISNDFVNGEDIFSRIIIVSDGVDNKSLGYTKDELNALLKDNLLPIYSIGCMNKKKSNTDQIENMFAISRLTGADTILLDDINDVIEINNILESDRQVVKYTVSPDASQLDGGTKAVKLDIGGTTYSVECKMPQKTQDAAIEPPAPDTEVAPVNPDEEIIDEEADAETADSEEEDDEDYEDGNFFTNILNVIKGLDVRLLIIGGVSLVLLIIIIVVIILIIKKSKKDSKIEPIDVNLLNQYQNPVSDPNDKTEIIGSFRNVDDDDHTCMIWNNQETYHVILTDVSMPARTLQIPLSGTITIGRKSTCDAVFDYEKSVSSRHCEISVKNGHFYVKDLQSSNGTFINNNKVVTEAEIVSGNIIKLGRLELRFEAR